MTAPIARSFRFALGMLAMLSGCAAREPTPSAERALSARAGASFWDAFVSEQSADYAESQPTLRALAESADAVVVARVTSISEREIRGDAPEDVFDELVLGVVVLESIRGSAGSSLELTAVPADFDGAALDALRAQLPSAPALLLLRKRSDHPSYRPVNGHGLWASTSRAELDAPLDEQRPGDGQYAAEVAGLGTLQELADRLR